MKVLVTGGGGFLGAAIVRRLVSRGDDVRSLSRQVYTELDGLGVRQFTGDVADVVAVEQAVRGCDLVCHTAAKAGIWGPYAEYYRANVVGTENVLAACRKYGVGGLVYTSSPSVVFTGRDEQGLDESVPYPSRYLAWYPQTKARAERTVLAANGPNLATVALRPHLIWGPGDHHLIPRLVARARAGKLRRIGDGKNRVDAIYIDNAADAHILAIDQLSAESPVAGKAYFLAQGEPLPLWDFIDQILDAAGVPPVRRGMSAGAAYVAGAVLELVHRVFRLSGEPRMTRFVARQLSTSHWYDLSAARRDLGYAPAVSVEVGLRRLRESFQSSPL